MDGTHNIIILDIIMQIDVHIIELPMHAFITYNNYKCIHWKVQ